MFKTEAWVLEKGTTNEPGELKLEEIEFAPLEAGEVLAEPIYGCWEGNMTHALERDPVDVVRQRGEERIILGNAGVLRVLETHPTVKSVKVGDICVTCPIGTLDKHGYIIRVWAYDEPQSMGLLAKQIKLREYQLIPLPANTKHSYKQWAAGSLKYSTAWSNWKVAYGCWTQQMSNETLSPPYAWGWGGGVAFGEVALAKMYGFRGAMVSSIDERLKLIEKMQITPVDRREFMDLNYNDDLYKTDRNYKKKYLKAENTFLAKVFEQTQDNGVSIFIDNIGEPV